MRKQNNTPYFSTETLARFVEAQGKKVEKIICHLWQNNLNNEVPLELIENIELHFSDKQKLTIACNESSTGMDAISFDYKLAAQELEAEFGEKIKLFSINASTTKMWEDVIGKTLNTVRTSKEGDYYKSDSVMLDFGDEKREISISPNDGLIIDYYEE